MLSNAETPLGILLQDSQLPHPGTAADAASTQPQGTAGTQADGSPANPAEQAQPTGGIVGMLLPFAILFLFVWFFLMRPERKRQRERTAMLAAVKKGDKVVTAGGLHGTVVRLDERTLTIKVDENVRLKFDRSAVGRLASADGDAAAPAAGSQPELANAAK